MSDGKAVVSAVLAAFENDTRINVHASDLRVEAHDGIAILDGDVGDIAEKRRAVALAGAVPGVTAVVDRVHVRTAESMGDGEIRDHVRNALLNEPVFVDHTVGVVEQDGVMNIVRARGDGNRNIYVEVNDGVVRLEGTAPSPSHRLLAGVLAWWVPGCADVVNNLAVDPPRQDNDDDLIDAVQLVLDKDPLVSTGQITIRCENSVVTLAGTVSRQSQKEIAEHDVWYIEGVRDLSNRLVVP